MAVPFELSKDGIESQFATNHLAHFLLTERLLPCIVKSAPSRIVDLSSTGHKMFRDENGVNFEKLNDKDSYSAWVRYGETKLANILHAKELDRRLQEKAIKNVYVNACHPGVVKTELARNSQYLTAIVKFFFSWFQIDVVKGALTQTV
jgi:retinol dehydrogenase-12